MDMKKILQAFDSTAAKPVEGASDMKRFVSIIQDSNKDQVLNEGANPHKVSLPVQMAMQHYQQPVEKKKARPALIDKYFKQVEEEQLQEKKERRQLINQYARTIAERVMMKESRDAGVMHTSPSGVKTNMPPSDDDYEINYGAEGAARENPTDTVTLDVPLLIRIMEYAREDAKDDMALHDMAENMINLGSAGNTLSMEDYNKIIPSDDVDQNLPEGKKIKAKKKSDPCWTGYTQVGMKKKDGRVVPNCTKLQNSKLDELSTEKLAQYKKAAGAQASAADKAGDFEKGNKRFKGIVKATTKQLDQDVKKHNK